MPERSYLRGMKRMLAYLPPIIAPTTLFVTFAAVLTPAVASGADGSGIEISPVATELSEPWGLAFLPDGRFLVTERDGRLTLWPAEGGSGGEISGLPEVLAEGQGGLLDVMVPRDFSETREVWLSYSVAAEGGGATAVGVGRLSEDGRQLEGFRTLFTGDAAPGGRHFGSRLAEAPDGTVFVTIGDRGTGPGGLAAQDPALAIGKVVHINRDGSPATAIAGMKPGVHSLGHRNPQGAAFDAEGNLWTAEHGAQGGDEINLIREGANYGWPVITYGRNYGGAAIGEGTAKPGLEQPAHYWDPSIAPSGYMIYSGRLWPEWAGDHFVGSLNSDFISRLDPDTASENGWAEERIATPETGRVRDIVEAPDGSIWFVSVTEGTIFRITPGEAGAGG